MKLTQLSRDDVAFIGYSVYEKDDTCVHISVMEEIGNRFSIDAVAGEGYEDTVYAFCCGLLGMPYPTAKSRIAEMLSNIGAIDEIVEQASLGEYGAAMIMLDAEAEKGSMDAAHARKSIETILKQNIQIARELST